MSDLISPLTDPVFHLDVLVMAGATAFYACLAIWAGLSRRHWFWRAVALLASIALLFPIHADEPLLMMLMALPAIALAAPWVKRLFVPAAAEEAADINSRARFGLRDLFLGTALFGMVIAICLSVLRKELTINWLDILLTGGVMAALSLWTLAATCTRGATKVILWTTLAICLVPASWLLTRGFEWLTMHLALFENNSGFWMSTALESITGEVDFTSWGAEFLLLLQAAVWIPVLLGLGGGWRRPRAAPDAATSRWRRLGRKGRLAAAMLLAGLLLAVYGLAIPTKPGLGTQRTGPNSYPRLMEVVSEVARLNPSSESIEQMLAAANDDTQRAKAERLRAAYEEIVHLTNQPCYVSLTWTDSDLDVDDIQAFGTLARCLKAEAQSAARAGRIDESVEYSLACLRTANAMSRDGLVIHWLVAISVAGMGKGSLVEVRKALSPEQAARLLADLQMLEKDREPMGQISARDDAWTQHEGRWKYRVAEAISLLSGRGELGSVDTAVLESHRDMTDRLLMTELALELYQSEQGGLPQALDALSPKYLQSSPIDPFSSEGKPLVYRLTKHGYLLYSVGPDGKDDGGKFGVHTAILSPDAAPDIDLDTMIRQ